MPLALTLSGRALAIGSITQGDVTFAYTSFAQGNANTTNADFTGAGPGDQIYETGGVKVIVDPMSLRYLEGAEVDYKEDLMGGGFAIKNPNASSTCGCGHSFSSGGGGGGHQH